MSNHRKIWKQISHVKNDQSHDSQSSISESRSTQSFRFSHVKFNKSKVQNQKSSKKFALANTGSRIKQFKDDRSFLQQSNRMKENSMIDNQPKQPLKISVKTSGNRKVETKMKSFLHEIKKIHQDMKHFADNILSSFEKMKNQLQSHLLHVSSQLLKFGSDTSHIDKVHQIFHKGFAEIRKTITVLPESLTKLSNECEQEIKQSQKAVNFDIQSPLLKFETESPLLKFQQIATGGKSRTKITSNFNFNKKQGCENHTHKVLDLPLMSNQKLKSRPSTQRRQHLRATSFEHEIVPFSYRKDSTAQKQQTKFKDMQENKGKQFDQVTKIDDIIFQMRIILNQSN